MSQRTVLVFNHEAGLGGASQSLLQILKAKKNKDKFVVVLPHNGPLTQLLQAHEIAYEIAPLFKFCRTVQFKTSIGRFALFGLFYDAVFHIVTFQKMFHKYQPAAVMLNSVSLPLTALLSRLRKCPVVWFVHDVLDQNSRWNRMLIKIMDWCALKIYCPSERILNQLNVPNLRSRLELMFPLFDETRFYPREKNQEIIRRFGFNPKDLIVGIVGRIDLFKGHGQLIKTLFLLAERLPKLKILMVGSTDLYSENQASSQEAQLKKWIRDLWLEDRVIFTEPVSDVSEVLTIMDCLIYPSIREEAMGLSVLEAMAMSKPVIWSKLCGCSEFLINGREGLMVDATDSKQIAQAIETILIGRGAAQQMGLRGREKSLWYLEEARAQLLKFNETCSEIVNGTTKDTVIARRLNEISHLPLQANEVSKAIPNSSTLVILNHEAGVGGASQHLLRLIPLARKQYEKIIVVLPCSGPLASELEKMGVSWQTMPLAYLFSSSVWHSPRTPTIPQRFVQIWDIFRHLFLFPLFLRKTKPHMVLINSITLIIPGVICRAFRVPILWWLHDVLFEKRKITKRLCTTAIEALAKAVICDSYLIRKQFRVSAKNIHVVRPWFDEEKFRPKDPDPTVYKEFKIHPDEPVIAITGRIDKAKGHLQLLKTVFILSSILNTPSPSPLPKGKGWSEGKRRISSFKILVIGAPVPGYRLKGKDAEMEMRGYIQKFGLQDYFIFTGQRADLDRLLSICDVLILPSIYPDSFPLSAVEAMAMGKAVIVSNKAGVCEFVEDGVLGLIVDPDDPHEMANAISSVIQSPELRERLGVNARKRIERYLSEEKPEEIALVRQLLRLSRGQIQCVEFSSSTDVAVGVISK